MRLKCDVFDLVRIRNLSKIHICFVHGGVIIQQVYSCLLIVAYTGTNNSINSNFPTRLKINFSEDDDLSLTNNKINEMKYKNLTA